MAWNQLSNNHSPGAHVAKQWYQKTWVILVFLFFFFPVGVFLMWKFTHWKKRTKQIFSGIFGVWFAFWALVWIAVIFGPDFSIKQIQIDSTETTIVLDINEEKILPIKLEPEDAVSTGLKYYSDDTNIVSFDDGIIKGLSEGTTTVYLTYQNINSNAVRVVVEDKKRIEAEKQEQEKQKDEKQANDIIKQIKALEEPTLDNKTKVEEIRKSYDKLPSEAKTLVTNLSDLETAEKKISQLEQAQREQERLEAEAAEQAEQERLAAEQAAQQKAEQEKAQQQQQETPQQPAQPEKPVETPKPPKQQTQQPPANPSNGRTIYRTPTGKKYHYDSSCNGGTYTPTTLKAALNSGLTPCKKCVH